MNLTPERRDEAALQDVLSTLQDIQLTLDEINARIITLEGRGIRHGKASGVVSGAISGAVVSAGLALLRASAGV
ncbi:hypothetical protein PRCB_03015 [Pantoea rodasii]|uniref:Uncharacterized protein n=1 Tax=Pantoea rodasii TaxID=1076549 RepID=A0A2M9WHM4_9GAMM|nr:hypothetical protein [Pantoea rodasii]ORM62013.1 hypothetical protein HA45_19475 [Pantoea rodasii]PJZ06999.1 hypothetical protein PRCB_03015 [Pantoea rodasii]